MNTFRSIEELIKILNREHLLLKEIFSKRKSLSFKYDYAQELVEYKEERIRYLIDYGVIRDNGDFLELEDVYMKFFEDVLEVNEEINVSYVQDYIKRLNENIDYYLKESNERRKYNYQREVKRCLKNIALTTFRNVVDLKRNVDNTYKNEPNYQIKKAKLVNLDDKRKNIALLIRKSEELIDVQQPTFFSVAMDVQMKQVVNDVKYQLNESYHNLIEIDKQIINYLNLIEYQNQLIQKIRQLKYLKDQLILEENTNVMAMLSERNPLWMEPQISYRIKLSIDMIRNSDEVFQLVRKVMGKRKQSDGKLRNVAQALPISYLEQQVKVIETINPQEIHNAFAVSGDHLFSFIMKYHYQKEMLMEDKLVLFCQLASQYVEDLQFTGHYETLFNVEYPVIYAK